MKFRKLLPVVGALVASVASASPPFAASVPAVAIGADLNTARPLVLHGDELAYYQNGLVDPIVVYVYAADGHLVGVVDPHGESNAPAMRRIGDDLVHEKFETPAGRPLGTLATSLQAYLEDQGYQLADIVSRKHKYTLLLVMPQLKPSDCQAFLAVEARFQKVVGDVMQAKAGSAPVYALTTLMIGSPKGKLVCTSH